MICLVWSSIIMEYRVEKIVFKLKSTTSVVKDKATKDIQYIYSMYNMYMFVYWRIQIEVLNWTEIRK